MITVHCKCKKSIMKFQHLKEGHITEYEGSCCKDLQKQQLMEEAPVSQPTKLSEKDAEVFMKVLENPPEPSEALKALMADQEKVDTEKTKKKFTYFEPKGSKK
jgi:hypothetical protein